MAAATMPPVTRFMFLSLALGIFGKLALCIEMIPYTCIKAYWKCNVSLGSLLSGRWTIDWWLVDWSARRSVRGCKLHSHTAVGAQVNKLSKGAYKINRNNKCFHVSTEV